MATIRKIQKAAVQSKAEMATLIPTTMLQVMTSRGAVTTLPTTGGTSTEDTTTTTGDSSDHIGNSTPAATHWKSSHY